MAHYAVQSRGVAIRVACDAFRISQTCFRYVATRRAENDRIANWLLRPTTTHRSWGFGLYYLYLRNVKGFRWNHRRVCCRSSRTSGVPRSPNCFFQR